LTLLPIALAVLHTAPPAHPFRVGERFDYVAKYNILNVGSATIEVASIDTVRNRPAYHFRFLLNASALFGSFTLQSQIESWTDTATFHAMRFRRNNVQRGKQYLRSFEILADSGYYRQVDPEPLPPDRSVSEPLDDASFLYFVRTTPLEVGKTYRFNRYYWAAKNPIVIKVLKRETLELPDGSKAPCLVLNPVVGETGLFAGRADARVWLTEDARRIPVQIRSRQPFGEITLKLQRIGQTGS
jgi:hypothetical protein